MSRSSNSCEAVGRGEEEEEDNNWKREYMRAGKQVMETDSKKEVMARKMIWLFTEWMCMLSTVTMWFMNW